MDEKDLLAGRFEAERARLKTLAYRMLGSATEADDAVQDAWLRLSRAELTEPFNLGGWLTTVVSRVCLDMLRARKSRGEAPMDALAHDVVADITPDQEPLLADSVGVALHIVLDTLAPAERVAFVLHDMFDLSFDEIATVLGRSSVAVRQLASRARRRVRGEENVVNSDRVRQRTLVEAFLTASRVGDFTALLTVLDPDVVLRADPVAVQMSTGRFGLAPESRGAEAVAATFKGRAQAAQLAIVDGYAGLVFAPGGKVRVVFEFTIVGDRIVEIALNGDPARHRELAVEVVPT